MATLSRDITRLMSELERLGCTVSKTNRGHWKVSRPGSRVVTVSTSPSDKLAMRNIRADLKRYLGIVL